MRDPKYDILFEPIQLGPKTLPNRFVQVPHCAGPGSDKPGFQAGFRRMKADGGWGGVFTEGATIAAEADVDPFVSVRLWDQGDVRNLSLLCDEIHDAGALVGIELMYGGSQTATNEARQPPGVVSPLGSDRRILDYATTGHALDRDDIKRIVELYAAAARRARSAGFDLITVYCAHGSATVLGKFLHSRFNKRTDEFGGSFENRARLAREVTGAVREAVDGACAVGVRFGIDTLDEPFGYREGGIAAGGEGHAFVEHVDDLVDYWDINVGTSNWGEDAGASRTHPENHQARYTKDVKKHTAKPVINVGRFTNPDTMVEVVRSGQCDIIGAARPSIADPFLPKKIEQGRPEEIRECIGCNMCVSRWEQHTQIICTQNATSGEEFRRGWHPERFEPATNAENDVLIVGAGPAGLECAIVLAKRGMRRVHLADAGTEIGGHMRWIPQLPGLGEWARVINWRAVQLEKLKKRVTFVPNARLDADAVLDYGAEIVIVATGATWATDGLNGPSQGPIPGADANLDHVLTPEQIMVEGKQTGSRVLIYDTDGYFMGHSLATRLATEGKQVTIVTPAVELAPYTEFTLESIRVHHGLNALGVVTRTNSYLSRVEPGSATLRDASGEQRIDVDSIVLATQRVARDGLFRDLKARAKDCADADITALFQIGDCLQPSFIAQAIFSGHRLAREIDSPNPSVPLPYIRERRLLGASEADYDLRSSALASDTSAAA